MSSAAIALQIYRCAPPRTVRSENCSSPGAAALVRSARRRQQRPLPTVMGQETGNKQQDVQFWLKVRNEKCSPWMVKLMQGPREVVETWSLETVRLLMNNTLQRSSFSNQPSPQKGQLKHRSEPIHPRPHRRPAEKVKTQQLKPSALQLRAVRPAVYKLRTSPCFGLREFFKSKKKILKRH